MKIFNLVCPLDAKGQQDSKTCHENILAKYPTAKGVKHIPNNHVVTFDIDYDMEGNLKNYEINEIARKLDGVALPYDKPNPLIPAKSTF